MYIYLFINKANDKKYVGQTIKEPDERMLQHRYGADSENPRVGFQQALRKYGWDGFTRHILEVCASLDELNEAEIYWIGRYDTVSPKGYNLNYGGGSKGKHSEESKRKMSLAKMGHAVSTEARKKISDSHEFRLPMSAESRAKLSDSLRAAMACPELKKRLSKSRTGLKRSDETKQKMSDAQIGKTASEETKLTLSIKKEELWKDPTYRQKMTAAHFGRKASEETKQKMAEAQRLRWASKKAKESLEPECQI